VLFLFHVPCHSQALPKDFWAVPQLPLGPMDNHFAVKMPKILMCQPIGTLSNVYLESNDVSGM
jgi:hypothetical protein